ncbi:putative Trichohyalin [Cyclospora cayetanensis]|uniref:Trichohyalin n=1 Tax=Cyclospora cayetanensis TaxID=88456 RepID=A0A1D3CX06_9EIME|nr:putative Trichohyalin [Cyclospora cayetanensis]
MVPLHPSSQAADAEIAAAAANIRLLEERVVEANKAAAQLKEAQSAIALLQAELLRLKSSDSGTDSTATAGTSPRRSNSSRCSAFPEGAVAATALADSPMISTEEFSVAGSVVAPAEDLLLPREATTAQAAAHITREAALSNTALDFFPANEREDAYAQQLLSLQQKLHAEDAALSVLRMQLSSTFKVLCSFRGLICAEGA